MRLVLEHPLSPYAQKVKIALLEKDLPFETRLPTGIGSGTAEDLDTRNPRGEVPVLVDDDVTLFDSTIILEYLEDRYPEPSLLPSSAAERAKVRTIEEVMDTHYEPATWGMAEIRYFKRAEGALAKRLEEAAAQRVKGIHGWLEEQLGSREWFNGERFGWGDLAVAPFVNGALGFGLGPVEGSALSDWLSRAAARASVQRVSEEASRSLTSMESVAGLLDQGLFKRQYRDHRLEWMIESGGLEVVEAGLAKGNIRFNRFP